jgi:DNA-binding MarR family transcriptional regulator
MTKQSMHELVTHLERHGYLVREADPADPRAKRVRLTPAGLKLERQIHDAIADLLDEWEAKLGQERFEELWTMLQELTGQTGALPDRGRIRLDDSVGS